MKKKLRRFHVRDIETKKVRESFTGYMSAINYFGLMGSPLNNFYEIYDSYIGKVVHQKKRIGGSPI